MTRIVSPRYGISYVDPNLRDERADVPGDIKRVVDGLEQSAMYGQGTFVNRPISTGASPGKQGRLYFATDEEIIYYDFGTGWAKIGAGTAKFTDDIGDGASTSITVNHNLNSRDLAVSVREAASPYRQVFPEIRFTDLNNITVLFDVAPVLNAYQVTIVG